MDQSPQLLAAHQARRDAVDPLLSPSNPLPAPADNCTELTCPGAAGLVQTTKADPDAFVFSFVAAHESRLAAKANGPKPFARLLDLWAAQDSYRPGPDSIATITWPSRDTEMTRPLLERGFAPLTILAVRLAGRSMTGAASTDTSTDRCARPDSNTAASACACANTGTSADRVTGPGTDGGTPDRVGAEAATSAGADAEVATADGPAGNNVRAAAPDASSTVGARDGATVDIAVRRIEERDAEAAAELWLDEVRWDAQFGVAALRRSTRDRIADQVTQTITGDEKWGWVAEREGRLVGLVVVQPPGYSDWAAKTVRAAPAAYLTCGIVAAQERGGGVGTALVRRVHAELDAAGISATLLHYAACNPLSGPFWSRCGYRPLLTAWGRGTVG
ncbi:MAG: GNAT family N-acetyltransferase [Catenulispora sp.]|nr:GNAT family N-acetyltransferase [Catenulispora sp.]